MGRVYKAEFRDEAMRLALSSGLSRELIAQALGVGSSTLKTWICDTPKHYTVVTGELMAFCWTSQRAIALRQQPAG